MEGDTDIAALAAVLADPGRAHMLAALGDGRALPASVLADEAGVAASTASEHLRRLTESGLVSAERHGRHRYFRLAGPHVGDLLEAMARVAPAAPVRSLKEGTRAHAIREARTCYDHLAGKLGTDLFAALLDRGVIVGGDGLFDPERAREDRLSSPGWDVEYRLGDPQPLLDVGIQLPTGRRPLIRYCIDWSEQRHHLGGALGAAIANRFFELKWVARAKGTRAVHIEPRGREALKSLGLTVDS
ncbi:MAG TPA: metalloregulator ArsR/SmtB family transcription factor [Solirubrobacteraceae bacterium]|nr:metalloregulator ArsR/SmtB family transcription factor [Solirubrobacteraceae bacterium]